MKPNYQLNIEELLKYFDVKQEEGLSNQEVAKNRQFYGYNSFKESKKQSLLKKVFLNSLNITTLILLIAAAVSIFINTKQANGNLFEGITIILIVILNALLGAIQEKKAQNSLDSLKSLTNQTCKVIRNNGTKTIIDAKDLVPGDIVELVSGDILPSDGRLLVTNDFSIDESPLTGESLAVEKNSEITFSNDVNIADRLNMAYSGCLVNSGRGTMIVTEIGMDTEMGKIANLLSTEPLKKTPLQSRLGELSKKLSYIALLASVIVFILGVIQGEEILEMFMTAVSLAVAAIPETLMVIVTLTLSVSVKRMVNKHAIIRKLPAVETLGGTSIICSDKTGTLTQNKMSVKEIWTDGFNIIDAEHNMTDAAMNVIKMASLCSNATISYNDSTKEIIGDATEKAIIKVLDENNLVKEEYEKRTPRIFEIPFNSTKKIMSTVHKTGDKYVSITKGAFDRIVPLCKSGDIEKAELINKRFGNKGMRVITVSFKVYDQLPDILDENELEKDLTLLGLIAIIDPPRSESKQAIIDAKEAGIRTIMITGDHILTASAIAKELGILNHSSLAITGEELRKFTDKELEQSITNYSVYARVSPEDKIRIVKAWQKKGAIVTMTGDGVNDAPALNAANVGCVMGITGTDVAKEASDIILTDDNFSTIIEAVKEGRTAHSNILKSINFLLSANISEILILTFSILLGWGAPVMAIHLLLINIIADGLPGFTFSVEKPEKDIMKKQPIQKNQGIFDNNLGKIILLNSIMFTTLSLFGYYLGRFVGLSSSVSPSHGVGQTMLFLIIGYSSVIHAFNCRSSKSIFTIGFTSNKKMFNMILISISILTILSIIPFTKSVLFLVTLSPTHWVIVVILSLMPLIITELVKLNYQKDED